MTARAKACCTVPGRGVAAAPQNDGSQMDPALRDCVLVPGGTALIGTDRPVLRADGEAPLRRKKVGAFLCERGAVTNAAFARFVADTGYRTEAERIGWSFVFLGLLPDGPEPTQGVVGTEWWRRVDGASWRSPTGQADDTPPDDHPVVQVSWNDARAYAAWAGGRLPSEAEWEHAARGGLGDVAFPWGERAPDDAEFLPCNIWQGSFPTLNTCADGYAATAPAISFEPNGYGLYNLVGNVWEWSAEPFRVRSLKRGAREVNARAGTWKLLKGGSFMCHTSYCFRYRIAARSSNTADSAASHMGFRVVYDAPAET